MMPYVYLKIIDLHDNNRFGSDQAISRDFFDFFSGLLVKINFIFLLTKNKAVLLITKTQLLRSTTSQCFSSAEAWIHTYTRRPG